MPSHCHNLTSVRTLRRLVRSSVITVTHRRGFLWVTVSMFVCYTKPENARKTAVSPLISVSRANHRRVPDRGGLPPPLEWPLE